MVDFGSSKILNEQKENKTLERSNTILGTPHYLAPEVLSGKGYNNTSDLWALGEQIKEIKSY